MTFVNSLSENTAVLHGGGIYGKTSLFGLAYIPFGAGGNDEFKNTTWNCNYTGS